MKTGFRGRGIKANLEKKMTGFIKHIFPVGTFYNAPRDVVSLHQLITGNGNDNVRVFPVFPEEPRSEIPPHIFNYNVSQRFRRYYQRSIPQAYVAEIPGGIVYGSQTNFVLTASRKLVSDVSREFGVYGGRPMDQSSLLKSVLQLPQPIHLKGNVAVITTSGANNFHHWNYDSLPRLQLLREARVFDKIDTFIISHNRLPFQVEAMRLIGIEENKVVNPFQKSNPIFQSDTLYAASLPSVLGTVSPWVVNFLRNLYNPRGEVKKNYKRIYLSRKNVQSRKIINNHEFMALLDKFDIIEVFPEDYSVSEMSRILAGANFIISVHGSGLSNLCFISDGTTVIDILAPYHQDGYYWMISNIRNSKYIGFFGEGEHPEDSVDLVKNKIDEDICLDIKKMESLLLSEISRSNN